MTPARVAFAALVLFYAVLGLIVLTPDALYSGDIGVKFVQARALAAHRFASLDIPYPGAVLDPQREFFPLRPPFVMTTGGETQAIFPPASAAIQAFAVAAWGIRGLVLVSIVSAAVVLIAAWKLAGAEDALGVLIALGLGGPLWFYAVSGWEHAPAVACGAAAFACAVRAKPGIAPLAAGVLLGTGATLRDEVLLLLPGLVLVMWLRFRAAKAPIIAIGAAALPLLLAAVVEVWWFERPAAAHLRHAVHFLQSAFRLTSAPNPDVPSLEPFTMRQRYETVIQYWLLGYGRDGWIAVFVLGLAVALLIRWRLQSSVGVLVWVVAILVLAAIDLRELITAPKWLAGLHRVSPYFVFALLPAEKESSSRSLFAAVLFTTVAYLLLAFAGVDTTGGKSLGPRLLLPLFPLLAVSSVARIRGYLAARTQTERWVGRVGAGLVAMAVAMHLFGTIPAYRARNHDDAAAVTRVAASRERVVVSDDAFTAQLLFPLYYRKIVFLADSPDLGSRIGSRMAENRVASAILVSRRPEPLVSLAPLRLDRAEQQGRMLIQYWRR